MKEAGWVALVDAVATVVLLLVGRYVAPQDVELVKALVAALQPIAVALVLAFAYREGLVIKERIAKLDLDCARIKAKEG